VEQEDRIEVAVLDRVVYVKPTGYARQANSLGLPDFLSAMFQQGCTSVTFDLKDCRGMDSTFMGVIAGAAMPRARPQRKAVAVINASEKLRKQLKFIGLAPVVEVFDEQVELPPGIRLAQVSAVHWPEDERARVKKIKQLHERLVELNEQNRDRFGPMLEMPEQELQGRREDQEEK
jgi:hypothetical protein